jgi:hypothetical protein
MEVAMNRVFAIGVVLALAVSTVPAASSVQSGLYVHITQGGGVASVPVSRTEMYIDRGPFVWVAPASAPRVAQPELVYGLRAWREDASRARVVVYAILTDKRAPNGRTETPISTFTLAAKESVEVKEAHAWGAPGLVVSAEMR